MSQNQDTSLFFKNCCPSLEAALQKEPLDRTKIPKIALSVKDPDARPIVLAAFDRHLVPITDGAAVCGWEVQSLTSLFRSDQPPPPMGAYPPKQYETAFALLDFQALELSQFVGDRRDEEMLEIYSYLRRRPDGKSLGPYHDYMWQAAAFLLGTHLLSRAEFEAILSRLERSCRTFRRGPTSKNYIESLWRTLGRLS